MWQHITLASMPMAESFGSQVAVTAIGALATAAFGGVAVGWIVPYGFYTQLIEVVRQQHYGQQPTMAKLPGQFEQFRISARVVEAKLHAYFPDEEARYLWHGVVDMLSIRYYKLIHGEESPRTLDMMRTHGSHPTDPEIPGNARSLFLDHVELTDDNKVMKRFEEMLNHSISLVMSGQLDPSPGGDAILRPGRGSELGRQPQSQQTDAIAEGGHG